MMMPRIFTDPSWHKAMILQAIKRDVAECLRADQPRTGRYLPKGAR